MAVIQDPLYISETSDDGTDSDSTVFLDYFHPSSPGPQSQADLDTTPTINHLTPVELYPVDILESNCPWKDYSSVRVYGYRFKAATLPRHYCVRCTPQATVDFNMVFNCYSHTYEALPGEFVVTDFPNCYECNMYCIYGYENADEYPYDAKHFNTFRLFYEKAFNLLIPINLVTEFEA